MLHILDTGVTPAEIQTKFDIHERTLQRIKRNREAISAMDRNRVPIYTSWTLQAKHPALESRVTEFIEFARDQRMPVSMHLIQERAKITADIMGITSFNAFNGWLNRFLRRSTVQTSYRLRGKGNASLPSCHASGMKALRSISALYEPSKIWNMDESGLVFVWVYVNLTCLVQRFVTKREEQN